MQRIGKTNKSVENNSTQIKVKNKTHKPANRSNTLYCIVLSFHKMAPAFTAAAYLTLNSYVK